MTEPRAPRRLPTLRSFGASLRWALRCFVLLAVVCLVAWPERHCVQSNAQDWCLEYPIGGELSTADRVREGLAAGRLVRHQDFEEILGRAHPAELLLKHRLELLRQWARMLDVR